MVHVLSSGAIHFPIFVPSGNVGELNSLPFQGFMIK